MNTGWIYLSYLVTILTVASGDQHLSTMKMGSNLTSIIFPWFGMALAWFSSASEYYVSPQGHDDNPGTREKPFAHIQNGVNRLQPGDTLWVRGGTYRETVTFLRGGAPRQRIQVKAFAGETPIVTGCAPIVQWVRTDSSLNIWKAPMKWTLGMGKNQVFSGHQEMIEARFPNKPGPNLELPVDGLSPLWPTFGEFSVPLDNGTNRPGRVISPLLRNQPPDYWKGAIYFGVHWSGAVAQSGVIESSKDGEIIVGGRTTQWWFTGDNYFDEEFGRGMIVGHMNALDQPGEWHWQDNTLYLIPLDGGEPTGIEAKARPLAFNLSGKSHITISGFQVHAASARMEDCHDCLIERCEFDHISHFTRTYALDKPEQSRDVINAGEAGIFISGRDNGIIHCTIRISAGAGIQLRGYHHTVHNCLIDEVDYAGHYMNAVTDGVADHRDTEHELLGGHVVTFNTMKNAGRHFFNLHGNGTALASWNRQPMDYMASLFAHNHVHDGMLFTRDAGFITSFFTSGGTLNGLQTQVARNVMHDNHDFEAMRLGICGMIYLDNGTHDVEVRDNLFWAKPGTAQSVFFLNTPNYNIEITNNTFHGLFTRHSDELQPSDFPGGKPFRFGHDFESPPPLIRWPPLQSRPLPVVKQFRDGRELTEPAAALAAGDVLGLGNVDFGEGWSSMVFRFSSDSPSLPKTPVRRTGPRHQVPGDPLVIEVERRNGGEGLRDESHTSHMDSGAWARFDRVPLGAGYRKIRFAFGNTNPAPRRVEIRLDATNGPLVGQLNLRQTDVPRRNGTWRFEEGVADLDAAARDTHNVFVVAAADDGGWVGKLEYIRFEKYLGTLDPTNREVQLQVRMDRPDGECIGTIFPKYTGASRRSLDLVTQLEPRTGVHPLFLKVQSTGRSTIGMVTNLLLQRAFEPDSWLTINESSGVREQNRARKTLTAEQRRPAGRIPFDPGDIGRQVRPAWMVQKAAARPVVDGDLKEWTASALVIGQSSDGVPIKDGAGEAWFARDDEALYIAARSNIRVVAAGADDTHQWGSSTGIEIALPASPGPSEHRPFVVRGWPNGTFSVLNPDDLAGELNPETIPGLKYKAVQGPDTWTCEWRIPWTALGMKASLPGTVNFSMTLASKEGPSTRTWSWLAGATYDLSRNGGNLILGSAETLLPERLQKKVLAWFDASDSGSIELDPAGRVKSWRDKTHKSRAAQQEKAAFRPTFLARGLNGHPTLQFDQKSMTRLDLSDLAETNQSGTVYVVFSNPEPSPKPEKNPRLFATSNGADPDYKVGIQVYVPLLETGGPRWIQSSFKDRALKRPRIGVTSPSDGTFLTGYISEVLVVGGSLSREEQSLIPVYLRAKWSLAK